MIPQFLAGPFWWFKHCIPVVLLVGIVPGVVLTTGASILVPVEVLVGSGVVVASGAVVVVVVHDLCVHSLQTRIASGLLFH